MRLKDVTRRFDRGKIYKGKYKKFECCVNYFPDGNVWYYCIDSKDERDIRYNSFWSVEKFKTQEECVSACQKYVDEVIRDAEISKKMG